MTTTVMAAAVEAKAVWSGLSCKLNWRNQIGYPAQPGLICPFICTGLQIS